MDKLGSAVLSKGAAFHTDVDAIARGQGSYFILVVLILEDSR